MKRSVVDLTCREVVELVTDYLGRRLQPQERAVLEQHLLVCPPCTIYFEQMRSMVELAGTLDQAAAKPPDRAALLTMFRRWKKGES